MKTQPPWYSLSHHDRYRRLNKARRVWCQYHYGRHEDHSGRTVHLDGRWINDIPSLHLSLGEAINGPNGYFGGCLDSLSDCLIGRFGVLSPLTIRLRRFEVVQKTLDGRAWCRFRAEGFQEAVANGGSREQLTDWSYFGDSSEAHIVRWTATYEAVFADKPFDCSKFRSYFDAIVEVLEARGAKIVPQADETAPPCLSAEVR